MQNESPQKPLIFLAPMAGYSDRPMRELVSELGVDAVVSEMMACQEWKSGKAGVVERIERGELAKDTKFIVQIAGRDPALMREAAIFAESAGAEQIDINMGCPAKKVISGATAGAALLLEPQLALRIVESVANAVKIPVSVKTRLGWDRHSTVDFAPQLVEAGAQMLTIHGRTRAQKFQGKADWQAIGEVKAKVNVPVIANGDITDIASAREALAQSGADGLMIGRGAIGAPELPAQIRASLQARDINLPKSNFIAKHYTAMIDQYGAEFGVLCARKHLKAYYREADSHWLKSLLEMRDPADVLSAIENERQAA